LRAVDDVVHGELGNRGAAAGAAGGAEARHEQAEVVVDLGDGPDGGPGVAVDRLLVDGQRRGDAVDRIDPRPLHLAEELAGVGGQRLEEPALALLVDGVVGERRLPGAGDPGEHHQRVAGKANVDTAQVVLARPAHLDVGWVGHG